MPRRADDDPYASLPDASPADDPYAAMGDASDLTSNAAKEGTYAMQAASGNKFKIPYSAVGRASKSGYTMMPEDRDRYLKDARYDPRRGEGIDLPEGVVVVGRNAAGQPILAPAGPGKPGSAARRFLSSAYDALVQPVKGAYHGLVAGPQTPEEARIASDPIVGPVNLRIQRFLIDPTLHEAQRTAEEYGGRSTPGFAETPLERTVGTAIHGLGTVVPLLGPAAAEFYEGTRQKYATGDYAGALGGGVGNVAAYLAPEGVGALAKSEWLTRTRPRSMVTKMIRPAQADLRFGKDPARAILEDGITGNTLENVGNKVSDRLAEVGQQLDREAQKYPTKVVDVSSALQPLDDGMLEAVKSGDRALFRKLQSVRSELSQNWQTVRTPGGRVVLRPSGPRNMRMSPYEALQYKRQIGDRIRWTSDPLDGAVNKALASAYGEVREATNNAVPGLADLNTKYSDLVGAAQAIRRRIPAENRNAAWSLSDILIGTHHLPLAITRHIARSPAFRSRAAVGLYNLPRMVPKYPVLKAAPAIAGASAQEQEEAERRRASINAAQP
jgi:hypothetical protein